MTIAVAPATPFDVAALAPAMTRLRWHHLLLQVALGPAWSAWDGESAAIVALWGLWPVRGAAFEAEAWISPGPACRFHLLPFVRACRLTLESSPYGHVGVRAVTAAGARLAGLVGFSAVTGPPGEAIVMEWDRHGASRPTDRRHRRNFPAEAPGPDRQAAAGPG